METIKGRDCQAGKWYQLYTGERMLCLGPSLGIKSCSFVRADYYVLNYAESDFTALPDCTGWDWQPPPKYRPFKDAWEFVRAVDGRDVYVAGSQRSLVCVDFSASCDLVVRFDCEWFSFAQLLERATFEDTGEPCGVKL